MSLSLRATPPRTGNMLLDLRPFGKGKPWVDPAERPDMSDIVVSAGWVADRLGEVRVVDVRDAWEYEGIGHVPTAVSIPFDSFRADEHAAERGGGDGMLPGEDAFADLLSGAGITRDDHVVAYDDTHGVFAARFLVTALLYGHDPDRLHLLDGDYSAWMRDHEVEQGAVDPEPTEYAVDPPAETPLVGIEAVEAAVDAVADGDDREAPSASEGSSGDGPRDVVIVDTREEWEYDEGHIPGAVRLDWRELVDDESRGLKPREEMESLLESRGITPEKRVVLYCNTARRISHTFVVLRHLGYEDVAFYEGSLTEWEADGRPLESG